MRPRGGTHSSFHSLEYTNFPIKIKYSSYKLILIIVHAVAVKWRVKIKRGQGEREKVRERICSERGMVGEYTTIAKFEKLQRMRKSQWMGYIYQNSNPFYFTNFPQQVTVLELRRIFIKIWRGGRSFCS